MIKHITSFKNLKKLFTQITFSLLIITSFCTMVGCKDQKKEEVVTVKKIEVDSDSWESLAKYTYDPEWFADSKLGIYFTWGPYCVAAYDNEWYPRWMHIEGHKAHEYHVKTYGDPSEFGYHDLIPMFKAEHYDPKEWAELFQKSGARFAGPIAQHHDGFAMWDSEVNPWNSADMGPKKDITGEVFREVKKLGMKTISTFHHARTFQRFSEDSTEWGNIASYFPYNPQYATSSTDDKLKYLYGNLSWNEFQEYWLAEIAEVVDKYQPDIIWFDSGLDSLSQDFRKKMVKAQIENGLKNSKETIVAYKQEDLPRNIGVLDIEQGGMMDISEDYWLTDMTISKESWSYINGQTYRTPDLLIRNMIDIWSKRGIVLLNVSPTANGTIPDEQRQTLIEIGKWIKKHEEAVYETRPYKIFGYGVAKIEEGKHGGQKANTEYIADDIRFTVSKDGKALYVYMLGVPKPNTNIAINHVVDSTEQDIENVTLVGSSSTINWEIQNNQLLIETPDTESMDRLAVVFKVRFK